MRATTMIMIVLIFAGCKQAKVATSVNRADTVEISETLVPRVITIAGDSLQAVFDITITAGGDITPATVIVKGTKQSLSVDVSGAGKVTARAVTPDRADTVMVAERKEVIKKTVETMNTRTEVQKHTPFFTKALARVGGITLLVLIALAGIWYLRNKLKIIKI